MGSGLCTQGGVEVRSKVCGSAYCVLGKGQYSTCGVTMYQHETLALMENG